MLFSSVLFPPSGQFWTHAAAHLIQLRKRATEAEDNASAALDFSACRVIVPAYAHARLLTQALTDALGQNIILPRINTLSAWLALQPPCDQRTAPMGEGERLMALYAQLRENAWLKKLFSARKNTDLLPLAQTLIALSDELTESLLPHVLQHGPSAGDPLQQVWLQALAELPAPARQLLSDEAELVWQIWKSQLDSHDAVSVRLRQMVALAGRAPDPLVWINPVRPENGDRLFLTAYARKQPVCVISLDWRATAVAPLYARAWKEMLDNDPASLAPQALPALLPNRVSTLVADNLELEAQLASQTIIQWLQQGKASIALIAQDRVVARRIRALLERAHIHVADETGWKLSTTRAASALAAWFEVIVSYADTVALLDFVKSPFFMPHSMHTWEEKSARVMALEMVLLKGNVMGGWDAIMAALESLPECLGLCAHLKAHAALYARRKTIDEWLTLTRHSLDEFGITACWQQDTAGLQVLHLLEKLQVECTASADTFSLPEWRIFMNLQLESAAFQADRHDRRVVMLPLNGARLRRFDAVLMAGCDAAHLPSPPEEVLFFTNAVRRECGLITREQRQQQQLRDLTELLSSSSEVVLSWQRQQRGEDNPASPWIQRLNLCLQQNGLPALAASQAALRMETLQAIITHQPAPTAAALTPKTLSASGYNSFIACPYQFFATRMLGLSTLDALSDMPEKRDYGGWLHAILKTYHDTLAHRPDLLSSQSQTASLCTLLGDISATLFNRILKTNPTALGFSRRWEKVIPAYVEWSQRYAESGWQFEMGEVWLETDLVWDEGQVVLRGQIDRIDRNDAGEHAVLDYKTSQKSALNKKLQQADDQQLPFYGLLAESNRTTITAAHYVALEKTGEKIDQVSATDYLDWKNELRSAIVNNLGAIQQGARLPAQGTTQVCQYCQVRGLCRKGAW